MSTIWEQLYACAFICGGIALAILGANLLFNEHWRLAACVVVAIVFYVVFGLDFAIEHDWAGRGERDRSGR